MGIKKVCIRRMIVFIMCVCIMVEFGYIDAFAGESFATNSKATSNYQIKIVKGFDTMLESFNIKIYLDGKRLTNKMIIKKVSQDKGPNYESYNVYKISKMKYGTHTLKITGDYLNTVNHKFTVGASKHKNFYIYNLLKVNFVKSLKGTINDKVKNVVKTYYTGAILDKKYSSLKFPMILVDSLCAKKYKDINTLFKKEIFERVDKEKFAIKNVKMEIDTYYRWDGIFTEVLYTIEYNEDFMKGLSEKEQDKYDKLVNGRLLCVYRNKQWMIGEFLLHYENKQWYWE